MGSAFSGYEISIIWVIILGLLILAGFTYLFSRERFVYTLLGFLRLLASIFYSPFLYFKKLFVTVNEFGEKGEKEFGHSKQYLLNKFLLILEGFLIIAGVVILSAGIVQSWNSFIPPKYLRDEISRMEEDLKQFELNFQVSKTEFDELESDWANNQVDLIRKLKQVKQNQTNALKKENTSIESKLAGNEHLTSIINYFNENSNITSRYNIDNQRDNLNNYIYYNVYDDNIKEDLRKYIGNWATAKYNEYDLANATEEYYRKEIQPKFESLKAEVEAFEVTRNQKNQYLNSLNEQAKYNFVAFGVELAKTILIFIVYIWFVGLLIEMLFLAVDLANNVRKLKEKFTDEVAVAQPANPEEPITT